jgi:hypothetical protein
MSDAEPKGCLAAILSVFGIQLDGPVTTDVDLPFRLRDDFLSAAEHSFYRVLLHAVGNRATVCPKVNLADIFFVVRSNENQRWRNKIDRKHVDFLLCDPATMKPRCGVELDDSSHARPDRRERDEFVDQVFRAAGLPLVRVPAQSAYSPTALWSKLEQHLNGIATVRSETSPAATVSTATDVPQCPKCGIPMVQRTAKRGPNVGQSFFGCPNYPKCNAVA